jgi:hypothetical protein
MAYRRINILPHLRQFRGIFGDLNVPFEFVIPSENNWSTTFHGVNLGKKLSKVKILIKKGDVFVEEDVKELYSLGLVLDSKIKGQKVIYIFLR